MPAETAYSAASRRWLALQRLRQTIRRVRQGTLAVVLLAVAIWGWMTWRADHRVFAWDRTVSVAFIAIVDESAGGEDHHRSYVRRFLSRAARPGDNLLGVERWIRSEYARHTGGSPDLLEFAVRGPLELPTPPPPLPAADASFFQRLGQTRAFLDYFNALPGRDDLVLGEHDVYVFLYFYDFHDRARREFFSSFDSVADRRSGVGVVFAPISDALRGHTCTLVAHELCHTFGASDKYDGNVSVFPQGFADPDRQPRYPQERAEIMSLGRPVARGKDKPVDGLDECIVGAQSAEEMNWRRD